MMFNVSRVGLFCQSGTWVQEANEKSGRLNNCSLIVMATMSTCCCRVLE